MVIWVTIDFEPVWPFYSDLSPQQGVSAYRTDPYRMFIGFLLCRNFLLGVKIPAVPEILTNNHATISHWDHNHPPPFPFWCSIDVNIICIVHKWLIWSLINEQGFLLKWLVSVYLIQIYTTTKWTIEILLQGWTFDKIYLFTKLLYYLFVVSSNEPQLRVQIGSSFLCADELQDVLVPHARKVIDLILILPRLLILRRKI